MLGLHNYLFGSKITYAPKKCYKPTLYEAFNHFLLISSSENNFEKEIIQWRNSLAEKKLKLQAFIVGFGTSPLDLQDKFIVIVEDLKYMFEGSNSLLFAVDLLLKFFFVFNLEFPVVNQNVYQFLAKKYLNIESFNKKKCKANSVTRLLNAFN